MPRVLICDKLDAQGLELLRQAGLELDERSGLKDDALREAIRGTVAFDPATRRLTNETRGTSYDPVPLTAKEEEIRRSGGIFAVGRREFRRSVETPPAIEWPERPTR